MDGCYVDIGRSMRSTCVHLQGDWKMRSCQAVTVFFVEFVTLPTTRALPGSA